MSEKAAKLVQGIEGMNGEEVRRMELRMLVVRRGMRYVT